MTWLSTATQWVGWLCVVSSLGVLTFTTQLHADDPQTQDPEHTTQYSTQPAPRTVKVLQEHVDTRGLVVFRQVAVDLNRDGQLDLAAHVAKAEPKQGTDGNDDADSALVVVVGPANETDKPKIVANIADGMLCPWCPIGTNDGQYTQPNQTLDIEDGRMQLCESWGSRWFAKECTTLRLDDTNQLRVERQVESSGWNSGPTEHTLDFDFVKRQGQRSYTSHPTETGFPILEREAAFAMLIAAHAQTTFEIDGQLDEPTWQASRTRAFGADHVTRGSDHYDSGSDATLGLKTAWTDDGLILGIDVADDVTILADCEQPETWVNADRLELWLDLGRAFKVSGNDDWIEDHRRVYLEDPIRHSPDSDVLALAIVPGATEACTHPIWPRDTRRSRLDGIKTAITQTSTGYTIEVFVPAQVFGADTLETFEGRWFGTGFTVAMQDVDDRERPQDATEIATSTLEWGDPFTFGVLVMPRRSTTLPVFPFDWAAWLE